MRSPTPARRRRAAIVVTIVTAVTAALALAGCGGEDTPAGPIVAVTMTDNTFEPADVTVPAGGSIRWTSVSRTERHTIIPVDEDAFDAITDLVKPGESVTVRFTEPGEYAYYCSIHGKPNAGQHGTVRVLAAA